MRVAGLITVLSLKDQQGSPVRIYRPASAYWVLSLRQMVWNGSAWVQTK